MSRQMLSFDVSGSRFQMRAVAIIVRDGHILIHRATHEQFWSLPGGRIEFGETAAETLEREVMEELGTSSRVGALRFLVENLFAYEGRAVHEIGWYFDVDLTGSFPPVADGICHRVVDGGTQLEFRWIPLDGEALRTFPLLPPMLSVQLLDPTPGFRHIIERQ